MGDADASTSDSHEESPEEAPKMARRRRCGSTPSSFLVAAASLSFLRARTSFPLTFVIGVVVVAEAEAEDDDAEDTDG